ncbi:MAG: hypothetical protein HOG71_04020, partial [Bacteroidetes bacterium]|nr:hypothetical protein [Bacteroidota bacterium]
ISTSRMEDDDWSSASVTAYRIILVKKSSIYDPDNGLKKDYYYGDVLHMKNDEMNGLLTIYSDGMISSTSYFIDDEKNGEQVEYYYNDENELKLKEYSNYREGIKDGIRKTYILEEGVQRLLTFTTYSQGIKNGSFQAISGDSLTIGFYKNDLLSGDFKIYRDLSKMLFGGVINTDTSDLVLINDGYYYDDLKSGEWRFYDITGTLRNKGQYSKDLKSGEWKYYYGTYSDNNDGLLPYSGKLFLIENYSNGLLNGKSTRFSFLDEEKYLCSAAEKLKYEIDSCVRKVCIRINVISFFKDDKLDGFYELKDSNNQIIAKGTYSNGLRTGEWVHRYLSENTNGESIYTYEEGTYSNNKRNGTWIQYVNKDHILLTFNYYQDDLHGSYTVWNSNNKPKEVKKFKYGKFKELIVFDSLGITYKTKYEVFDEKNNGFQCRKTKYLNDGLESQVYWVKKDGEIDHNWFEFSFLININNPSSGFKDGEYILSNNDKKPIITGYFLYEKKINKWVFYYYDKGVKIIFSYSNGIKMDEKYYLLNDELFSGEFTYIDKEKNIKELRKIKNGLRNGKTIFVDINSDKIIKKESYKEGVLK